MTAPDANAGKNSAFTAAAYAARLGITKQSVKSLLVGVGPDNVVFVNGQSAKAWSFEALPKPFLDRLDATAVAKGFRNAEHLMRGDVERWEPAVRYADCTDYYQERARKLSNALAWMLQHRNDPSLLPGELQKHGLEDYKKAFGHAVTERRLMGLFYRTTERAGTSEDFSRSDYFLDERPAPRSDPASTELREDGYFELRLALRNCLDQAGASAVVKQNILERALEAYELKVLAGAAPRVVKGEILDLLTAGGLNLAANREALRIKFDRAYRRRGDDKSLQDGRRADAEKRRKPIPEADRRAIETMTVFNCGGRLGQAWRKCLKQGRLSKEFASRFRGKHVPKIVRRVIGPGIPALMAQHHGARGARDNGAWIDRIWDDVPSRAWYCMDDVTLPVYFYVPDGSGRFTLMRGQFLLAIDTRSTCILGYALMPERNYNARVIRTLITRLCDEYGLPLRGFYFERGIWENSKILTGERNDEVPIEFQEVERGLKEFDLEFKHAIRARSKPIERVIGALQNLMEGDPGYAGRNEITAGFEEFKKLKLQVESQKLDPRDQFYSHEQWDNRLSELCQEYNADPQDGKMTKGLSPEQAFQRFQDTNDKPIRLDARCRYLFAHHRRLVKVGANGITLRFGKQAFNYKSEKTGPLQGRTVIAWFNPETPDVLAVTDTNRENAFCVDRSLGVPAIDAPKELIAQETERAGSHMKFASTRYRVLKAKFVQEFRPNLVSAETVELGRNIEREKTTLTKRKEQQTKARKVYSRLNAAVPVDARPEQIEAMEELGRLLQPKETQ